MGATPYKPRLAEVRFTYHESSSRSTERSFAGKAQCHRPGPIHYCPEVREFEVQSQTFSRGDHAQNRTKEHGKRLTYSQILIFKSGKLIIIGAKSEADARTSADKSAKDISRLLEKKLKVESFNVTNIVANADIGMKIDIGQLAQNKLALKDETFPGVIYRMGTPVKAVLVFSSGKIVFTGARTKNDIEMAFEMLKKDFVVFKSKKDA